MRVKKGKDLEELRGRLVYLKRVFLVVCLVLLAKAFHLQVVKGDYYRERAKDISIRQYQVRPPRGRIFDGNGVPLAINRSSFNLYLVPGYLPKRDIPLLLNSSAQYLALKVEDVEKKLSEGRGNPWLPILLKRDLSQQRLAIVEERSWLFPGTMVMAEGKRYYPHGSLASHVLGCLGEVNKDELRYGDYYSGDMIGRAGIEKEYERLLRGVPGWEQWEVDARGRKRKLVDSAKAVPGCDVYLTFDIRLQQKAYELLKGKSGAIVALDPRNGDVLAMASFPGYDPNIFVKGITPRGWEVLSRDPLHPLQNRCIQGLYPAGSVFKIVVALAGLEAHKVKPSDKVFCTGGYYFKGRVYRDWKKGGHGEVDLRRAIVESCDVYFYQLGHNVGVDTIHKYGSLLGLGSETGIDLPGEKGGLLPSTRWKKRSLGQIWFPGETLSLAIGQGYLQVTPLQLALMLSRVVNGGLKIRPHLLFRVAKGKKMDPPRREKVEKLPFKRWNLAFLKGALEGVVENPHGTGRAARIPGVRIGGKTGTAQVVALQEDPQEKKKLPPHWREHAWFVAFAPVNAPKIAVSVLVEHGGHGGSAAAPLAREMIRTYFQEEGYEGRGVR